DNTDKPVDNNPCTDDVCTNGVPSNPTLGDGTGCGNGLACVGGACTGCTAPSECPGTDDECKTRKCTAGACGFGFPAANTAVASQTTGDCKKNVCDGAGNVHSVADTNDKPVDGNQCTDDVCTGSSPSNPLKATDTPCTQGGGSVCSATGTCVPCNTGAQ